MTKPVTAAMLYDLVACPHRVSMDLYADPAECDEPNKRGYIVESKAAHASLYVPSMQPTVGELLCIAEITLQPAADY